MSFFKVYKPGQAKLSRMAVFLSGEALLLWGAGTLVLELPRLWRDAGMAVNVRYLDAPVADAWSLDVVLFRSPVSISLLIGLALVVGVSLWWFRFLNRERWADLLIDMETELHRVSWPTLSDAWLSTLVVTAFTVILVVLMVGYDLVFKLVLEQLARVAT